MRPEPGSYKVTARQTVGAWITTRSSRQIILKAQCQSVMGSGPSRGDPKKIIAVSVKRSGIMSVEPSDSRFQRLLYSIIII